MAGMNPREGRRRLRRHAREHLDRLAQRPAPEALTAEDMVQLMLKAVAGALTDDERARLQALMRRRR